MKKTIGIILIVLGILSLIGNLRRQTQVDEGVKIMTFILEFGLIIGGILLASKSSNKETPNSNN